MRQKIPIDAIQLLKLRSGHGKKCKACCVLQSFGIETVVWS